MQVSVETTGALERRMTVQIPAERVDQEVENRLKRLAKTARLDGFRPGKVPMRVVQRRYGPQVRAEVVSEVMRSTLQEALTEQQLRPAGGPSLEPRTVQPGQALEYTATFEVYPEFEPAALDGVKIDKPVATVTDQDVEDMLENLRTQRRTWEPVEREARTGDRLMIDFAGTIGGEPFSGGKASNVPLELGSGAMIPGFEDQLNGVKPGEQRTIDVTFPDDYNVADLAGKTAQFDIKVHSVSEPKLPDLDEEFARAFGVTEGGVDKLREEVRRNMERELEQAVRQNLKEQVFDAILEKNDIEVPHSLVEDEVHRMMEQAGVETDHTAHGEAHAQLEAPALRRVKLGLVLGEIVRRNELRTDPERVRKLIESIAASYEDPDEVVKWYQQNAEMRSGVEAMALEEQVLDWVMDQAELNEKSSSFKELMNSRKTTNV
ncbi:MAG: trigger factor [Gammaproteobacteria bacterium]|jgi:trigger factor